VLFAVGAFVLFARKSGHNEWSSFALLLVVAVPAATLYALAVTAPRPAPGEAARPWQTVLLVTSILLGPIVLLQLLDWLGARPRHVLYVAAVFAVTGLIAAHAARRTRVSYAALLAALALLVSWLLVWGKILDHPSADTYRWLLVAGGLVLFLAAAGLWRDGAIGAGEVATAGGIAAVAAGVLGVIVGSFFGAVRGIVAVGERSGGGISSSHLAGSTSGLQHFGWDLYLLVVSVALVWIGSRARLRGPAYVGGVGLLAFVISAGAQITRIESGKAPTADLVGWPLALLIVGVAGLAAPALYRRRPS
jgi:hypothetical protein